jgi:hypothetical protein
MYVDPPKRSEQLLKFVLAALGITAVIVMLAAIFFFDQGSGVMNRLTGPAPATEAELQEQIAPLIKAGDMKACDQVKNEMYRSVCINNIALDKAEETNDIAYCRYLDDKLVSQASCERRILIGSALESEDVASCSRTDDASLREECEQGFFFGLAQKKKDPKICDQDADKTKADQCWNGYHARMMSVPGAEAPACSVFRGGDVQTDCTALLAARADSEKMATVCGDQLTDTFAATCLLELRDSLPGGFPVANPSL